MHVLTIVRYNGKIRGRITFVAPVGHLDGNMLLIHIRLMVPLSSLKEICTCKSVALFFYKPKVTEVVHVLKDGDSYAVA